MASKIRWKKVASDEPPSTIRDFSGCRSFPLHRLPTNSEWTQVEEQVEAVPNTTAVKITRNYRGRTCKPRQQTITIIASNDKQRNNWLTGISMRIAPLRLLYERIASVSSINVVLDWIPKTAAGDAQGVQFLRGKEIIDAAKATGIPQLLGIMDNLIEPIATMAEMTKTHTSKSSQLFLHRSKR